MTKKQYRICLILDINFGNDLINLVKYFDCWVIESLKNLNAIKSITQEIQNSGKALDYSISTFPINENDSFGCFVNIVQSIMDHHNEHQHAPGINELWVCGLELDDNVREEMQAWDFNEIEEKEGGLLFSKN